MPVSDPGKALPLFQQALGAHWTALPVEIRGSHDYRHKVVLIGQADVTCPKNLPSFVAGVLLGLPSAGKALAVQVAKRRDGLGEHWVRTFGQQSFRSFLRLADTPGCITERFGLLTFEIPLEVRDGSLLFPVSRGWILGIPLPRWALPVSTAREYAKDGLFHFDVQLDAPMGLGQIIRYKGWLEESVASSNPRAS